jgi:hypothetical protein
MSRIRHPSHTYIYLLFQTCIHGIRVYCRRYTSFQTGRFSLFNFLFLFHQYINMCSHSFYWLNCEVGSFRLYLKSWSAQALNELSLYKTSSTLSTYHGNKFISKKNNICYFFIYTYDTWIVHRKKLKKKKRSIFYLKNLFMVSRFGLF